MQFLWSNSCCLATQKTTSLHITLIFFLLWILQIISFELVFCFVFDSFLNCVCSVLLLFKFGNIRKKQGTSHLGCSLKVVLKSLAKLTGKYWCQSRPETLLRKIILHRYFPVIFTKFSQNIFFIEHFWALALSLLLESTIFSGFVFSNLPDVYLWVFWFTLHMFFVYLLSNKDQTNSFDSHKVCALCLLTEKLPPSFFSSNQ